MRCILIEFLAFHFCLFGGTILEEQSLSTSRKTSLPPMLHHFPLQYNLKYNKLHPFWGCFQGFTKVIFSFRTARKRAVREREMLGWAAPIPASPSPGARLVSRLSAYSLYELPRLRRSNTGLVCGANRREAPVRSTHQKTDASAYGASTPGSNERARTARIRHIASERRRREQSEPVATFAKPRCCTAAPHSKSA